MRKSLTYECKTTYFYYHSFHQLTHSVLYHCGVMKLCDDHPLRDNKYTSRQYRYFSNLMLDHDVACMLERTISIESIAKCKNVVKQTTAIQNKIHVDFAYYVYDVRWSCICVCSVKCVEPSYLKSGFSSKGKLNMRCYISNLFRTYIFVFVFLPASAH